MAANAIVIRFGSPTLLMDPSSANPEKFSGDPVNVSYTIESGTMKSDESHSGSGRLFVTQLRMIIVKSEADVLFSSMTIPYRSMVDFKLKKPLFGSHYISGMCHPLPNSGWTKDIKFVLKFKNSSLTKSVFDSCNSMMERSLADSTLDHDSIAKLKSLPAHVCLPGKFRSPMGLKSGGMKKAGTSAMSAVSSSSSSGGSSTTAAGEGMSIVRSGTMIIASPTKSNPRMAMKRSVSTYSGTTMIIGQSSLGAGALTETFKAREAPTFSGAAKVAHGKAVASAEVDFSKMKKKRGIMDQESKDRRIGRTAPSIRQSGSVSPPTLRSPPVLGTLSRSLSAGNLPGAFVDPAAPDDIIVRADMEGVEGHPDEAEIEVDATPHGFMMPGISSPKMGIALSQDASDSDGDSD